MHPISDNELDKLFQKNFVDLDIEPANTTWDNISDQLDGQKRAKKNFPSAWMAAAGVVIVLSAGLWLFRPVEVIKLHGLVQNTEEVVSEPLISGSDEQDANTLVKDKQASDFIDMLPKLSKVSKMKSSEIKNQENIHVPTEKEEINSFVVQERVTRVPIELKAKVVLPELNSFDKNVELIVDDQVLAKSDYITEDIQPEEQVYNTQRKIKSIGSLVNFVIAKVDRRENKIIEFKDGDEGSELAGLNLGIVKYRNRK